MYADASKIRQAFWTAVGKYLSPLPNSEGLKINWINYHTGFKHVYFRMDATKDHAAIAIQLSHPDETQRELFFERLKQMRPLLQDALGEEWIWEPHVHDGSGKEIARISKELLQVNVYQEEDWPAIISFLKPRIMGLDRFWNDVKDALEDLR